MNEEQRELALEFNRSVRLRPAGQRLSSNGGAILLRELDHRLGIVRALASRLRDRRDTAACTYSLEELLRTWLIGMALGRGSQSDADRLRDDAAMRAATTQRRGQAAINEALSSQPTMTRLIDALATPASELVEFCRKRGSFESMIRRF